LYKEANHNKTESSYMLGTNLIEFVSTDQPQKVRGRKRSYLFINECNEISYDAWIQLALRTEDKIVIDYNPSMEFSFIYDNIITRDDADFYITTFRDNPFLDKNIVSEIERLKDVDENMWKVYGLGERGQSQLTVYTHWKLCPTLPFKTKYFYGLDWGFRAPTALVKCVLQDDAVYVKEELYEPELTMDDLVARMGQLGISKRDNLWCDSADPKSIEHLRRYGYNAKKSIKKIEEGIRAVKSRPLFITEESTNIIKEIRNYKWKIIKDSNNEVPEKEQPIKLHDHSLDALRYAVASETSKKILSWV
jgi:phage terminase large subunit